ncbi:helix-turn-helix domain-containing protein [Rhizocola hellebori]|uniref:helix-turn-helix domain-containing protein n=1 Tax=Rhizocola hellebori TaxID=1392758 RepID=UPI00194159A2
MAKRELRPLAEALRSEGLSVPAIAAELGIARSTAFRWTKHLPREGPAQAIARRKAHAKAMTDARWSEHRLERDTERAEILASAAAEVGQLSDRELLLSAQPSTGRKAPNQPRPGGLSSCAFQLRHRSRSR